MCQVEFPYHPNIYQLDFSPIKRNQEARLCQVCGCVPELYLDRMYSTETIHCLCLQCVASGAAADQFDGAYIQDAEWQKVSDPALVKNFFRTTPGYTSWQGEYWLACCDDFCNFIDYVGIDELNRMPEKEAILSDYESSDGFDRPTLEEYLSRDGDIHYMKWRLWEKLGHRPLLEAEDKLALRNVGNINLMYIDEICRKMPSKEYKEEYPLQQVYDLIEVFSVIYGKQYKKEDPRFLAWANGEIEERLE